MSRPHGVSGTRRQTAVRVGLGIGRAPNAAIAGHLPHGLDRQALAQFVLTVMEGGVMQARTHRDVAYFDRAVAQLREHFKQLEIAAGLKLAMADA